MHHYTLATRLLFNIPKKWKSLNNLQKKDVIKFCQSAKFQAKNDQLELAKNELLFDLGPARDYYLTWAQHAKRFTSSTSLEKHAKRSVPSVKFPIKLVTVEVSLSGFPRVWEHKLCLLKSEIEGRLYNFVFSIKIVR